MEQWLNNEAAIFTFSLLSAIAVIESILTLRRKTIYDNLNNKKLELDRASRSFKVNTLKKKESNNTILRAIYLDYAMLQLGLLYSLGTLFFAVIVTALQLNLLIHVPLLIVARLWIVTKGKSLKEIAN
jgi:hypothetical protein